jgi:threonyl-tRNA synthetase
MLDEYLVFLEEAKKRDHRKLGKQLDLYSTHEEAGAGLVYWHPKGARIRLEIENFWREAHLNNGYEILYSPIWGKAGFGIQAVILVFIKTACIQK